MFISRKVHSKIYCKQSQQPPVQIEIRHTWLCSIISVSRFIELIHFKILYILNKFKLYLLQLTLFFFGQR